MIKFLSLWTLSNSDPILTAADRLLNITFSGSTICFMAQLLIYRQNSKTANLALSLLPVAFKMALAISRKGKEKLERLVRAHHK